MSCLPAHDLGRDSGAKYDLHGPKVSPCFPWNDGSEEHCLSWFVIIISSHLTSVLTVDEPMNTSRLLSQRRATTPHLVLITWYPGSFIPPCAVSYLASMILLINLDEAVVLLYLIDQVSPASTWKVLGAHESMIDAWGVDEDHIIPVHLTLITAQSKDEQCPKASEPLLHRNCDLVSIPFGWTRIGCSKVPFAWCVYGSTEPQMWSPIIQYSLHECRVQLYKPTSTVGHVWSAVPNVWIAFKTTTWKCIEDTYQMLSGTNRSICFLKNL